jgi:hypothetical protein
MSKVVTVVGEDFAHGLITSRPAHTLPYGAAEYVKNVDFSRRKGRIPKRRGIASFQASAGAGSICGLFQFVKTDGSKFNIAAANNTVYSVTGGVWTARHAGAMGGLPVNFCMFQNRLIMVGETETTMKWDGVTANFQVLLGTPPANGKYICVWQNRVWIANTSSGKSRIHYSNDGNSEDWTTVGATGFIDINIDDGDQITGILPVGPALYVFKNRTIYKITGTKPDNFVPLPVILNRGCVSPRSLVSMGGFIVYMSQYGIHSLAGDTDGFLSEDIQFDIEDLTNTVKSAACAGKYKNNYILAFDSDGDGKNDSAYVLDMLGGTWMLWTNINAKVFCTFDDGTLISGASDLIKLRQHDTGEDDEGVAIDMIWRSSKMDFADFTAFKRMLNYFWNVKPIAGKTLTSRIYVDGVSIDVLATDITAHQVDGNDEAIKVIGYDGVEKSYGRFLQLEFENAELAAAIEISGFSAEAELTPRLQAPS